MAVSGDDLHIAIAWLDVNEGEDGEADACARVARWLEAELRRRAARGIARQYGVSAAVARKVIAKAEAE